MKALLTPAIFTGFSTKADQSLAFRGVTPELTTTEKVALMNLQGINVELLIQPKDYEVSAKVEVRGQFDTKTPSQRLRAVLFVLWKQSSGQGEFDDFYKREIENLIESVKNRLSDNG